MSQMNKNAQSNVTLRTQDKMCSKWGYGFTFKESKLGTTLMQKPRKIYKQKNARELVSFTRV
jgi:hypothetical protein